MWCHKNKELSISFLGVFFPTSPLISLIFIPSHGWFLKHFVPLHIVTFVIFKNQYLIKFITQNKCKILLKLSIIDIIYLITKFIIRYPSMSEMSNNTLKKVFKFKLIPITKLIRKKSRKLYVFFSCRWGATHR